MLQHDVELVRRAMGAWKREDVDELISLRDPDVRDAGSSQVVVFFRLLATARASGVPVDERVTTVFRLREAPLHRMVVYRDRDEALEAAGLPQPGADT